VRTLLVLAGFAFLQAWPPVPPAAREVRVVMGSTAEVRAAGLTDPTAAFDAAFAALDRVDDAMSLWKPSELERLNDAGAARVSADVLAVLLQALDVAAASDGAFDPTVEPLVRASGGLGGAQRTLGDAERHRLLASVGYRRVHVDEPAAEVRLEPGTRLDFGGIAKGYAADLVLAALKAAGATSGLVDLGSSSLSVFGEPLTVVVRDPDKPTNPPWATFRVRDAAVSSSGGDQRPGHIVDPRSGRPATGVLSATVVARTGIEADALSTAVYVLGAQDGLALLQQRGAAGFVLLHGSGGRLIRTTASFASVYSLATSRGVRVRE
jgi:thiamine biosynthesis lipoprotein